jgi:hypothetical protein
MQVLDEPLIGEDPARFRSQEACAKWLADFHEWLRTETGEIEAGAAREAAAVADARARMTGVTLCRH